MTILFANLPWWAVEDGKLRRGVRAGSRWPFTNIAQYRPDQFQFGSYLPYPFFLGSAAAWAQRAFPEHKVILRDSVARGESYQTFLRWFQEVMPDCLIVETGAASWEHDRKFIEHLRTLHPFMRVAVCGPTAKSAYEEQEKIPKPYTGPVNAFLLGEFEKNAADFINDANGLLPFNLLTREELANVPFPMFDEDCALNYWDGCPQGQQAPHLQLFASRGCVFKCSFCAWPANMTSNDPDGNNPRSIRHYSVEWLEKFIRHRMQLAEEKGTPLRSIYWDDDFWNNNKRHNLAVCEMMKRIGLPWSAMCRADTSDKETWQAMRNAGCFGVKVGFESGSQRVIDKIINKHLDVEMAVKWCHYLKSIGLTVHTTWTLGTPGERPEEVQMTKDLIARMYREKAHDTHQESGTAIIDGTPLALIEQGAQLPKYPEAKVDEHYVSSRDGVSKREHL